MNDEPVRFTTAPRITLDYQPPAVRAIGTFEKQVGIAFATAFLLGVADILAKAATGDYLDGRALALALGTVVVHAGLVALHKYTTSE